MRKFKVFDCWVNAILFTVFFIYGLAKNDSSFIIGYYVVGGWQVISMLVHYTTGHFTGTNSNRIKYAKLILWIAISLVSFFILAQIIEYIFILLWIELFALLVGAPIMAIYYIMMCYEETYIKMRRPLALLK